MPRRVRPATITTPRGSFAALVAPAALGVSERHPALLVPGYTGSKEDFLAVLESLAAGGRSVTAIDMRGQYQSDRARGSDGYALSQLAEDLLAVAAVAGGAGGRVHLLGHSFGGLIARQAVLAEPAGFLSLTLLGSGPGTIGGVRAQALGEFLEFVGPAGNDTGALSGRIGQIWEQRLGPQAVADGVSADVLGFLRGRLLGSCPVGLTEMARHLLDCPDLTAQLAAVAMLPKLVGYGENDDAWPPEVQDLMAVRIGAERVRIPGAGHSPAVEAPETTAAMLTAFWNAAEPPW